MSSSSSSSSAQPHSWLNHHELAPEVRTLLEANADIVEVFGFQPDVPPNHYFRTPKMRGPGRFVKAKAPTDFNKPQGRFEWSTGEDVQPTLLGIVSSFTNDPVKLAKAKYGADWTIRLSSGSKKQSSNPYLISPEGETYLFRTARWLVYVLERAGVYATAMNPDTKCEPVRAYSVTIPSPEPVEEGRQQEPRVITFANFASASEAEQGYFCTRFLEDSTADTFKGKTHVTLQQGKIDGKDYCNIEASTRMFKPNTIEVEENGIKKKKALPFDASVLPDLTGKFAQLREFMEGECSAGKMVELPNIHVPTETGTEPTTGDARFDIMPGALVLVSATFCWCFTNRGNGAFTFMLKVENITLLKQGAVFTKATTEERIEKAVAPKAPPSLALARLAAQLRATAIPVGTSDDGSHLD